MKYLLLVLFSLITSTLLYAGLQYSTLYTQDSPTTATSGLLFKKTLNLQEYHNVASGNNLLGNYENYSRSDRHNEVVTVYCKSYCKKH